MAFMRTDGEMERKTGLEPATTHLAFLPAPYFFPSPPTGKPPSIIIQNNIGNSKEE